MCESASADPVVHPAIHVDFGPRAYETKILTGQPPDDVPAHMLLPSVSGYDPDRIAVGEYVPEFPANGTRLEQARWLAGLAALGFGTRIEVVENFGFGNPGFHFRFYRTLHPEAFSLKHVGEDYARIASFLDGMTYARILAEQRHWWE
jgi:hypothetical protein